MMSGFSDISEYLSIATQYDNSLMNINGVSLISPEIQIYHAALK